MRSRRRRQGGFVLLAVLVIVVVLAIIAGAYLNQAAQAGRAAVAASGQQLATLRAEAAAQDAIRAIRANEVLTTGLFGRAPPLDAADCANVNCVARVGATGGSTLELRVGGGMQWEWVVYRSNIAGSPANRLTIQATGFYGYTPTSAGFTQARVEVEIDIGTASAALGAAGYGGNSGAL